jgi:hypothetical protein
MEIPRQDGLLCNVFPDVEAFEVKSLLHHGHFHLAKLILKPPPHQVHGRQ